MVALMEKPQTEINVKYLTTKNTKITKHSQRILTSPLCVPRALCG